MLILNKQYLQNNMWYGENSRERNRTQFQEALFIGADIPGLTTLLYPKPGSVWGIDVSHWNGLVDMATAKMNGCSFAIIKAADGSVPTKWFQENKQRAKDAGLPWGAYVWLYPDEYVSIVKQVDFWWSLFKDDYPPVGVHIDFEWTYYGGKPANPTALDLRKALDLFEQKGGKVCEVYTAKGYADTYLIGFTNPERYKWWIANYGVSTPNMPRLLVQNNVPWKKWQFTASLDGSLAPCQAQELDGNYYAGDHYQFAYEYLGGELPPDNGDDLMKYFRWNGTAANIRTGAGTNYPDRGDLIKNDVVAVSTAPIGGWYGYSMAQHSDGSWVTLADGTVLDDKNTVTYWSVSSYMVEVTGLPKPPVTDPPTTTYPPIPYTVTIGDGVTYEKTTISGVAKPLI